MRKSRNDSRMGEPGGDEALGVVPGITEEGMQPEGDGSPADDAGEGDRQPATSAQLQRDIELEKDRYLRLAAEFDNFRKRSMKERTEAESRGQAELVRQLLDPLDDIARFADLDPQVTECSTVVQGVDMVEKKLEKALRSAGLESLNPVDQQFDPSLHEAVATEPAASPEDDGTVAQVYQVGYTFKGQLLRPARVVVRQHPDSH